MNDYLLEQIAALNEEIAELRLDRVMHRAAQVTSADAGTSTFAADLPDGQSLAGLSAPPQFLPAVGDWVRLRMQGATPIYEPAGIAEDAITGRELAPGAVAPHQLSFDIDEIAGTKVFYGSAEPTASAFGDLWLKEVEPGPPPQFETWRWVPASGPDPDRWELLADQGASSALAAAVTAQQAADAKAKLFVQSSEPSYSGAAYTAYWTDTANGNRAMIWDGADFVPYRLGNGAIEPNSLVASDVVATGTITAGLLEAILVLVTAIIAGDPNATHAALEPDGLHIYDEDGNEVARLGTSSNDYFGIVNSLGELLASIDDTGKANFSSLSVSGEARFKGVLLEDLLAPMSNSGALNPFVTKGGQSGAGFDTGSVIAGVGPATGEYGLVEVVAKVRADRRYLIGFEVSMVATGGAVPVIRIRDGGSSSPTISSPLVMQRQFKVDQAGVHESVQKFNTWIPAGTGERRLLLTIEVPVAPGSWVDVNLTNAAPTIIYLDMGPNQTSVAQVNRGGGGVSPPPPPPAPPQQHYVELGHTSRFTYRGNGTLRTDTTDVVQGYNGANGDGYGFFRFGNLPSITGTVDRVDLYLYFNHWYYNSGGSPVISLLKDGDASTLAGFNALKLVGLVGTGWPKPGGVWFTVPSSWLPYFANAAGANRMLAVGLGQAGSTNLIYYGRASDCRVRVWWTQ